MDIFKQLNKKNTAHRYRDEEPHEFAERMMMTVNASAVALGLSVGVETGLFKTMTSLKEPKTSAEIAEVAGLKERYVREWLAAMVVARVVDVDATNDTYSIPKERAPFLSEGPRNVVAFTKLVPMLCEGYDNVLACFRKDGPSGVPYSKYKRFHQFMDYMSNRLHTATLIPEVVPSVPGLSQMLESGVEALDIGCGSGRAVLLLAQKYPRSIFYGVDISDEAIAHAKSEAKRLKLTNCNFLVHDATQLPKRWSDNFDFVMAFDCIHDMARPKSVMSEIHRVLSPGGTFAMLEINVHSHPSRNIGNPRATDGYVISLMHCMPVSLYFEEGEGLGTMWGKEHVMKALEDEGFGDVTAKPSTDTFNLIFVSKKKCDS